MKVDMISAIASERFGGVEKYALNVLRHFSKMKTRYTFRLVNYPPSVAKEFPFENRSVPYGSRDIARILLSRRGPELLRDSLSYVRHAVDYTRDIPNKLMRYRRQMGYSFGLREGGSLDIVHSLDHFIPYFVRAKCVIGTIHDLGPLRKGELYPKSYLFYHIVEFPWQLKRCDKVAVDSPGTLEDAHLLYGIPLDKLVLMPLGVDDSFKRVDPSDALKKHGINTPYVFYPVGTVEPRKNIQAAIEAMRIVRRELRTQHILVLMGRRLINYPEVDKAVEAGVKEGLVKDLGYVEQSDVPAIYSGADLVIYPSLYEGFGLPILESMACGTPTVVSRIDAHEFVGGDAAYFFANTTSEAIAKSIVRLAGDEQLRSRLSAAGLKHAAGFRWENTAKKILDLYDSVL